MLDTNNFVEELISNGYTHLCVVPCSFAKNLINSVINNTNIEYVPAASEAVACSIAAGLKMSGKSPIVIVQSSGLTNMGSCITSLLKPYGITFPMMVSWRTYKEGDSEIQHQHLATELPRLVHAYGYEHCILDNTNIDTAISQLNNCNDTNTICLLPKDSFSKIELKEEHKLDLSSFIPRSEYLKRLNSINKDKNTLFIGTTGNTAREMYSFMPDTNNFYMAGNMGGALSLGLGASMGGKRVIVCGGDAEFVMHMGGLTTAGRYRDDINLTYILFDNECNKSTGGQNTYQKHLNYINIVKNSGILAHNTPIENIDDFTKVINNLSDKIGLNFLYIKCSTDVETPRPPIETVRVNIFK
ncbi:MAG: thiamine pyrophosphate-binding protein [Campylobacteraceae bacterium]|nr:thiamine pyrophosphate-binding protein [Campylobacteraceae bacterium]